jgi:hypothetical protein
VYGFGAEIPDAGAFVVGGAEALDAADADGIASGNAAALGAADGNTFGAAVAVVAIVVAGFAAGVRPGILARIYESLSETSGVARKMSLSSAAMIQGNLLVQTAPILSAFGEMLLPSCTNCSGAISPLVSTT